MMKVECCDNCKRPFISFDVKGIDKIDTSIVDGKAYGFVVKEGEIEVLMSDLEYAFCCFVDPLPEREKPEWQYWCVDCIEAVNNED